MTTTKPKFSELGLLLRKVIAASISSRVAALSDVIGWYDSAMPWLLRQKNSSGQAGLTTQQRRYYELAAKTRVLGTNNSSDTERELALRKTIQFYEKIWSGSAFKFALVDDAYNEYDKRRQELEAEAAKMQAKFQEVLAVLNGAFSASGVELACITSTIPRQFDGQSKIFLGDRYMAELTDRFRKQGAIEVVLGEAYYVTKAAAVTSTPTGPAVDPKALIAKLPAIFDGIKAQLRALPKASLGAGVAAAATNGAGASAATTKAPRAAANASNLVGGRYHPGSAQAIYYERLSDGNPHTLDELAAGLDLKWPKDPVYYIGVHGKQSGKWEVVKLGKGNTVQYRLVVH